jgi:hypothetical protein
VTIGAAAPAQVAPRRPPRLSPEQANTSPILRCQTHLLEVDGPQVDDIGRQLIEPTAEEREAQITDSAAVVATRAKRNSAAGNRAVGSQSRSQWWCRDRDGQRLAPVVRD